MPSKEQIDAFKKAGETVFSALSTYEQHEAAVAAAAASAADAAAKKVAADDAVQGAQSTRDLSLDALRKAEAMRRALFDETFGPLVAPSSSPAAV